MFNSKSSFLDQISELKFHSIVFYYKMYDQNTNSMGHSLSKSQWSFKIADLLVNGTYLYENNSFQIFGCSVVSIRNRSELYLRLPKVTKMSQWQGYTDR